jgi:hydroxymethylbilane synthase
MNKKIVIGTRGSRLAVWQAEWVKTCIEALRPGIEVCLKTIKTTGDKILDALLANAGGKGLFVKEIEEALLCGEADIAVHSMKDMPAELPQGLRIAAVLPREDPRDALALRQEGPGEKPPSPPPDPGAEITSLDLIPEGAVVGTGSLRRSCQLRRARPDLNIVPLRGNIETRLKKLDEGLYTAVVLAAAGLKRLGLGHRISGLLSTDLLLPAAAQGAVGIEIRAGDRLEELISSLDDPETAVCVKAERRFLKALDCGCQAPVAVYARLLQGAGSPDSLLVMDGLVGDPDGRFLIKNRIEGHPSAAEFLGNELALKILNHGAKTVLDNIYNNNR